METQRDSNEFKKLKWQVKPKLQKYPTKRWGHTSTILGNRLYIYGGKTGKIKEPVYRISCENFDCEAIDFAGLPEMRESHSCTVINGSMYIFGGCQQQKILNDCLEFRVVDNAIYWKTVQQQNSIPARESHASLAVGDKHIFIYGGSDEEGNLFSDFWVFNIETGTWVEITNIKGALEPKLGSSLIYINKEMYLFGGEVDEEFEYNSEIYRLQFSHKQFEDPSNLPALLIEKICVQGKKPSPRSSHACIEYKNRYLIVIGGEGCSQTGPKKAILLNDMWCFDTKTTKWSEISIENSNLLKPRSNFSANIYKNNLIIFGGLISIESFKSSDEVYMLSLSEEVERKETKILICNICKFDFKTNSSYNTNSQYQQEQKFILDKTFTSNLATMTKIASTISNPFDAFGLILSSIKLISEDKINKCTIDLGSEHSFNGIHADLETSQAEPEGILIKVQSAQLSKKQFQAMTLNYNYTNFFHIEKKEIQNALKVQLKEKIIELAGYNLKTGCARLGAEFLWSLNIDSESMYFILVNPFGIYSAEVNLRMIEIEYDDKTQASIIKKYLKDNSLTLNEFFGFKMCFHISCLKRNGRNKSEVRKDRERKDIVLNNEEQETVSEDWSLKNYLKRYFLKKNNLQIEIEGRGLTILPTDTIFQDQTVIEHQAVKSCRIKFKENHFQHGIRLYHCDRFVGQINHFTHISGFIELWPNQQLSITNTRPEEFLKVFSLIKALTKEFEQQSLKRKAEVSISDLEKE